ncbi:MAG: enoyl-CoA hydratase/isomerase family protein [Sporichthyaceae bacterium]
MSARPAETADGPLHLSYDGAVAVLTLHRPERYNALDAALVAKLGATVAALAADPATRAVVLTGSGEKAFSAGADLEELDGLTAGLAYEALALGQRVFRAIETCGTPVIAAVNGLALGGGMELALSATFMVASTRGAFGLPENGLGLMPGYGGTQRLPRLIGRQAALHLMLSGDRLAADRAHACGLVPLPPSAPEQLLTDALAIAQRIAGRSPTATAAILRAVDRGFDADLDTGLAFESALAGIAVASPDAVEGIAAFRAKRPPEFEGKP